VFAGGHREPLELCVCVCVSLWMGDPGLPEAMRKAATARSAPAGSLEWNPGWMDERTNHSAMAELPGEHLMGKGGAG